jgi:hypothetical protein
VVRTHKFAFGLKTQQVGSGWTAIRLQSTAVIITVIRANATNNSPTIVIIIIIVTP